MTRRALPLAALASFAFGFAFVATHVHAAPPLTNPPAAALSWVGAGAMPLPSNIVSARLLKADQPILSAPWEGAPRRGSGALDVHLPIFSVRRGPGCVGRFLAVGPLAWVCEDNIELAETSFVDPNYRAVHAGSDGLPFRYYFVGPDGSFGYKRLSAADVGTPDMQLEPGFAVAIVEERVVEGARYGRSHNDLWVPMRDLGPARPLAFRGEDITDGPGQTLAFAWVIVDKAKVFHSPNASSPSAGSKARFERVPFFEEKRGFGAAMSRIGEDEWIRSADIRHPLMSEPPPEVDIAAGERWIDVDLASQTLVAYEGKRPTFATLVSTGKGREGSATATPPRSRWRTKSAATTSNTRRTCRR